MTRHLPHRPRQIYHRAIACLSGYNHCMRVMFVADGRSPIALNWMRYFTERHDQVYLASTFRCTVDLPLRGYEIVPVAFSSAAQSSGSRGVSARARSG